MGQKRYSQKLLHPIRHMDDYVNEITAGSVAPYRTQVLKKRFGEVKKLSYQMYRDAYVLIQKLDGEQLQDSKLIWDHELKVKCLVAKASYGDYSKKNLHPIRHFEEYLAEIKAGNLSEERVKAIKNRLAIVLQLAVQLYFDSERLLLELD